jgi:hypothetical protein
VVGAACMFCRWLSNPTDEQKNLFSYHPQFWYLCKYPLYLLLHVYYHIFLSNLSQYKYVTENVIFLWSWTLIIMQASIVFIVC